MEMPTLSQVMSVHNMGAAVRVMISVILVDAGIKK
jgi:hypothetical protein